MDHSWHRTPPISRPATGKRLDFASPGRAARGEEDANEEENHRSQSERNDFYPVDARLQGEPVTTGTLNIVGRGVALFRTAKEQRSILANRTDNRPEVTIQLDYTAARVIHANGAQLAVGGDTFVFRTAADANLAAALLANLPKTPSLPSSRRRHSLDLASANHELGALTSPVAPLSASTQRRNAVALSPSSAERLRASVRDFVKKNSPGSLASLRELAPGYFIDLVVVESASPPKLAPPTHEQLKQLMPLVTAMTQRAHADKRRIAHATSLLALSPNAKQGRPTNQYVSADDGSRVSPSEYERRYRACEGLPRRHDTAAVATDKHARRKAELRAQLDELAAELHRSFEAALERYLERKTEITRALDVLGSPSSS